MEGAFSPKLNKVALCSYLGPEFDEDHVLVWGGISDDFHVFDGIIKRRHKLHEVVAGHCGRDCENTQHGATPHLFF